MSMYSTISSGIKDAMRNKDRERLAALRDIKSKLMLEATKTGTDGDDIPDAVVIGHSDQTIEAANRNSRPLCPSKNVPIWKRKNEPKQR